MLAINWIPWIWQTLTFRSILVIWQRPKEGKYWILATKLIATWLIFNILRNRLEESRTKALLVKSFAYKDDDDDNVTREESDEPEADQDQDGDREESRSSEELYQSDSDHYNEEVEEDVKEERSVDEYEDDDYEKESLSSHSSNPSAIDEDIPYESDLDWMIFVVKYFNLYQITIPKFYVGTLPYVRSVYVLIYKFKSVWMFPWKCSWLYSRENDNPKNKCG